jgi:hypothetical protein
MTLYYCCTQENNDCPNKEKCMRYLNANTEPHATLFKYACTEENEYLLFMAKAEETDLVTTGEGQTDNEKEKSE